MKRKNDIRWHQDSHKLYINLCALYKLYNIYVVYNKMTF